MKLRLLLLLTMAFMGSIAQGYPAYYDISEHDQAQAEARQRNLPLAWLGGYPEVLSMSNFQPGSTGELQEMAMAALKDNAVIIFFDGTNMAPVPTIVHAQFHIHDDGQLPGGADWNRPKVVFTNPEVTQTLGRVSETEMRADREAALNSALQIIRNNPTALALTEPSASSPALNMTGNVKTDKNESWLDDFSIVGTVINFITQYGLYVAIIIVCLVGFLFWLAWSHRRS